MGNIENKFISMTSIFIKLPHVCVSPGIQEGQLELGLLLGLLAGQDPIVVVTGTTKEELSDLERVGLE